MLCEERTLATSCNMFCGWHSSGLVFLKVVINSIDNVDSEGIDCTRFIKNSKYCGMMLKIIDKECEQADLLKRGKDLRLNYGSIISESSKTEFFQVRGY